MKIEHVLKTVKLLIVVAFAVPTFALAHGGEEPPVVLEGDTTTPVQAGDISLSFQMVDTVREKAIKDENLEIVHEKKLHMFIFDEALVEFRHVHPEFNAEKNRWVVTATLPRNGNYWVWAQGTLIVDESTKVEFTTNMRLAVVGGQPENPLPPQLSRKKSGNDGNSVVKISTTGFKANEMAMPTLTVTRNDGTSAEITPFLGAKAHVIGVLSDGDTLIHAHPVDHHGGHEGMHEHHDHGAPNPNQFMIHTVFPEPGSYRLWVQYIDGGVLRTIPLAVKVVE